MVLDIFARQPGRHLVIDVWVRHLYHSIAQPKTRIQERDPYLMFSFAQYLFIRAVLLAIIVEKSKKCLDFGLTLLLLHFFFCIVYGGLPRTWDWYIIHILGTITMVLMGEYLCAKKELDEIPLLTL